MHQDPSHYQESHEPGGDSRDPMILIFAAIAAALAMVAIVVGVIALTRDDKTATVPSDFLVNASNLENESITEEKLAAAAVSSDKLADGAVTLEKLAEDARAEPAAEGGVLAEASVETDALVDGAVRRAKIRDGAINDAKLADGAVTEPKLADGAVTSTKVADDSITGDDIDESTLGVVPLAESATVAETAMAIEGFDPASLGLSFVSGTARSANDASPSKGPVEAACPAGAQAIGGGAAIVSDTAVPVALTASTLRAESSWIARAQAYAETDTAWELEVTVVCVVTSS